MKFKENGSVQRKKDNSLKNEIVKRRDIGLGITKKKRKKCD